MGSTDARNGRNALRLALGAVFVCCRGRCARCAGTDLPGRGVAPGTIPSAGVQALSQCHPQVFRGSSLCQGGYSRMLRQWGLAPYDVVLEITEHGAIDYRKCRQVLDRYRSQGFLIALDDFGAGHADL
nr:EAL domain-containing protein [Calditerricola satsumensis]